MRAEVEAYLAKIRVAEDEKNRLEREEEEKKLEKQRRKVLIAAGLFTQQEVEVTQEEYNEKGLYDVRYSVKTVDGVQKYFKTKKVPLEVTDEEYQAVAATIKEEKTEFDEKEKNNWAVTFFTCMAWIIWIGGLIVAIITSRTPDKWGDMEFSFTLFLGNYAIYVIAGCISLCAAELFKKLHDIWVELREMNGKE